MGTDFNFSFLLTGIVGGVRRTMLASLGWGGIMLAMQMCLVWLEVGKQSLLCLKPFWTAKVPQNTSVKKRKTVFSLFRLKLEVTLDSLGERTKCRHHWNRFPISKTKLQLLTDLLFQVDPLFISQFQSCYWLGIAQLFFFSSKITNNNRFFLLSFLPNWRLNTKYTDRVEETKVEWGSISRGWHSQSTSFSIISNVISIKKMFREMRAPWLVSTSVWYFHKAGAFCHECTIEKCEKHSLSVHASLHLFRVLKNSRLLTWLNNAIGAFFISSIKHGTNKPKERMHLLIGSHEIMKI